MCISLTDKIFVKESIMPHLWAALKNKETENRIYEERFNLEDGQSI